MNDAPQLPPANVVSMALDRNEWQIVLALLHDVAAPLRITGPLVQAISMQCMRPRTAELHELRQFPDESA